MIDIDKIINLFDIFELNDEIRMIKFRQSYGENLLLLIKDLVEEMKGKLKFNTSLELKNKIKEGQNWYSQLIKNNNDDEYKEHGLYTLVTTNEINEISKLIEELQITEEDKYIYKFCTIILVIFYLGEGNIFERFKKYRSGNSHITKKIYLVTANNNNLNFIRILNQLNSDTRNNLEQHTISFIKSIKSIPVQIINDRKILPSNIFNDTNILCYLFDIIRNNIEKKEYNQIINSHKNYYKN